MTRVSNKQLQAYRARTYRLTGRLRSPEQASGFVDERGFVYFWPISGVEMPSLWAAVAGDRPVPNDHDDPGHVPWGWKDAALGKRIWYYAKVLRRKATMISLAVAPHFYALSENYGSPEEDHLLAYAEGRLTLASKQVYEALLDAGPLHSIELRRAARLANAKDSEFNRALEQLQADFKILPVGVAQAGAWRYAFIYDIVPRHYPDLPGQARAIGEAQARQTLAGLYLRSVGAAQRRDVQRLFGWKPALVERTLKALVERGEARTVELEDRPGEWLAHQEFS